MSLPSGWAETTLSQCSEAIQYGLTCTSSPDGEGYRYVRITDIQNRQIKWRDVPYANERADKAKPYAIEVGDILFARTGATVGKSHLIDRVESPSVFASYLIRLRCSEGVLLPQFAAWYFQSKDYWEQISEGSEGTGQPNFNGTKLAALTLPLPPLREQRRIVEQLDLLAARLARARSELDKATLAASQLRGAVLSRVFLLEDELVHPLTTLGEITSRITKGSSPRWQGFEYQAHGTLFVRSQNVGWGKLTLEDPVYLSPRFNEKCTNSIIRKNDILLNIVGASIGRAAIASEDVVGANCNQAVAIIRPTSAEDAKYIMWFLISPAAQIAISDGSVDVARANFSLAQAKLLTLPWPSIDRRSMAVLQIEGAFARADRLKAEVARAHALLDRLESALLAKAFKGELVPQDPNDEPATVLLDRIRAQRVSTPKLKRGSRHITA